MVHTWRESTLDLEKLDMTQTETVKSPEAWWASLSNPTWLVTDSLMQPSSSCSSPSALRGFTLQAVLGLLCVHENDLLHSRSITF